jgi:hypothetical protein
MTVRIVRSPTIRVAIILGAIILVATILGANHLGRCDVKVVPHL